MAFCPIFNRSAKVYLSVPHPNPPYHHLFVRHLRIRNPRDVVVYVPPPEKRSFWFRFSFPLTVGTVGALLLTAVDRYNTVKTVPAIPSDVQKLKLRVENVAKSNPSTIAEFWKVWNSPTKPVSGTEKSFDEVKVLIAQNHDLEMAEIEFIKDEQKKMKEHLEQKKREEDEKKKRSWFHRS